MLVHCKENDTLKFRDIKNHRTHWPTMRKFKTRNHASKIMLYIRRRHSRHSMYLMISECRKIDPIDIYSASIQFKDLYNEGREIGYYRLKLSLFFNDKEKI